MIENSVVSLPPCWVAQEVNAADLPIQRATRPEPACLVQKLAICEGMRPNRVPTPRMMASYCARSSIAAIGAAWSSLKCAARRRRPGPVQARA